MNTRYRPFLAALVAVLVLSAALAQEPLNCVLSDGGDGGAATTQASGGTLADTVQETTPARWESGEQYLGVGRVWSPAGVRPTGRTFDNPTQELTP